MQNFNDFSDFSAKIPTIKAKILSFSLETGVKISTISKAIGVAHSNFRGKNLESSLNAEAASKFLVAFPQVSADWLMRDEGPMLRSMGDELPTETNVNNGVNNGHIGSEHNTVPADPTPAAVPAYCDVKTCELLKAKEETILSQKDTIEAQRITIQALQGTKG